jgi:hypothetical protein
MVSTKWIPLKDGIELIVDREIAAMGDYVTGSAYFNAWNKCIDLLAEGQLLSKPLDPTEYWLKLTMDDGETDHPLTDPGGMIPSLFWYFYRLARGCQLKLGGYSIPPEGRQELLGDFGFVYSGDMKGNGIIEGFAGAVEVEFAGLPGNLPRPAHRPPENDDAVIMQAIQGLERGLSWNEVRAQALPLMSGYSVEARSGRFARKMRQAGKAAPRSKKLRDKRA